MKPDLREFIKVADEQKTGEGTFKSATTYARKNRGEIDGLKVEVSFGAGRASAIPWIAVVGFGQTVTRGIYPVYLYYKEFNILVLAYGVSEKNPPSATWNIEGQQSIEGYFEENLSKRPAKYGNSLVYKAYDVNRLPSDKVLRSDLDQIIGEYHTRPK